MNKSLQWKWSSNIPLSNNNWTEIPPKEINIVDKGKVVGIGLCLDQILFDEDEYIKKLSKEITVIDESLPFKDSVGFYVIDSKLKPRPVTAIVLSKRDSSFWIKEMTNNKKFSDLYNFYCHSILNNLRKRETGFEIILYYPSKHGKVMNDVLNKIYKDTND